MIYKVQISEQAEKDLREIYTYIAFEILSEWNPKNQLERLEKAIESLNEMPNRFKQYKKGFWENKNLRILPQDNYNIFYLCDDKNKIVTIIRIIYCRRNIDEELANRND